MTGRGSRPEEGRVYFHDEDGGHTIRSAIAENPMLHANFTALSSIEPELLPVEVLRCENMEFRAFSYRDPMTFI